MGELSLAGLEARGAALCVADELAVDELMAFDADARRLAPGLDRAGLARLRTLFASVTDRIADEKARITASIGRVGSGRKALRGYGSLRSARMCQRASTRA